MIDFIVIGAQKAGTTWLYHRFRESSEINTLPIKEVHYFDRHSKYESNDKLAVEHLSKRLRSYSWVKNTLRKILWKRKYSNWKEFRWVLRWYFGAYNDAWYLSLFNGLNGVKGEITPAYSMLDVQDIKRMYAVAPQAKLIMILRDPIDRAWSHFRFNTRKKGRNKVHDATTEEMMTFLDTPFQQERNAYRETLQRYASIFPADQILVGFYDAIQEEPSVFLGTICSFLGVQNSASNNLSLKSRSNKSVEWDIPEVVYEKLLAMYEQEIKGLSDLFGGYASQWRQRHYSEDGFTASHPKCAIRLSTVAHRLQ